MSFFDKTVSPSGIKHAYNERVEQYRGLCAILVLLAHGFGDESMLGVERKWPLFLHYLNAGYLSVMIFFCISGYVIGITNDREKLNVKDYLKKRAVRLYPVYIVALMLCIIFAGGISLKAFTGNILFLQSEWPYFHFQIPIFVNYPTWSLNYEAIYYLVFILIFFLRPSFWKMLIIMLACSVVMMNLKSAYFLTAYINGFYFWMLGLVLAWDVFKLEVNQNARVPLLSLLFLHLCVHHLGVGEIILHAAGIYTQSNINWLFDLPFCLMVLCILTGKDNRILKINKIICYSVPGCIFTFLVFKHRITEDTRWIMCLVFWCLSLVFYNEKSISAFLLNKLTGVGKISYGLYLLHIPVGFLLRKYIFIHDSRIDFATKYTLWIGLTFSLSMLMERVLQPAIKRSFISK